MATDPRKRQRKLERTSAKRKTKQLSIAKKERTTVAERLSAHPDCPIINSCAFGSLKEGMCSILLSRRLPNGAVAYALFLVDAYCLGVKDASLGLLSNFEYQSRFRSQLRRSAPMAPAMVRKLVEQSVDYANKLGFHAHPDYRKARLIFGDIDASECTEEFVFGKDGKPFFFAGPNDDEPRCKHIINTLLRTCGEGNFDYLIPLVPGNGILATPNYQVDISPPDHDEPGELRLPGP